MYAHVILIDMFQRSTRMRIARYHQGDLMVFPRKDIKSRVKHAFGKRENKQNICKIDVFVELRTQCGRNFPNE